jgi:hypothetical protein
MPAKSFPSLHFQLQSSLQSQVFLLNFLLFFSKSGHFLLIFSLAKLQLAFQSRKSQLHHKEKTFQNSYGLT